MIVRPTQGQTQDINFGQTSLRVSCIASLVSNFDGNEDTYSYLVTFKQVCTLKSVTNIKTKIDAFGLNLESNVFLWFQMVEDFKMRTFDDL